MVTVVEPLQRHAEKRATDRAFVLLDGERKAAVSYSELDSAARRVAAEVSGRGAPGEPVLLLYPPGRADVERVSGCPTMDRFAEGFAPADPAARAACPPGAVSEIWVGR